MATPALAVQPVIATRRRPTPSQLLREILLTTANDPVREPACPLPLRSRQPGGSDAPALVEVGERLVEVLIEILCGLDGDRARWGVVLEQGQRHAVPNS